MIWVIFLTLSVVAASMVLLTMKQTSQPADRSELARTIFVDQLREIEIDQKRGLISSEDAKAARSEISRNILRLKKDQRPDTTGSDRLSRVGILLSAVFVPLLSFGYYVQFGSPGIQGLSRAEMTAQRDEREAVVALANRLETELRAQVDGGETEGWTLLGQTRLRLQDYDSAVDALAIASERDDALSSTFSIYAEALILKDNGTVSPLADAALARALSLDPKNPAAIFFSAVSVDQSEQPQAAYEMLITRLNQADNYYPWFDVYVAEANRIGARIGYAPISAADFTFAKSQSGPSAADIAAAEQMSAADRSAFIASMVDRLATRLEQEPDDLDGWIRLGNAYLVLGNRVRTEEAIANAARLLSDISMDDPRHALLADLQRSLTD